MIKKYTTLLLILLISQHLFSQSSCTPTYSLTNITICPPSLPYIWNGQLYNSAGNYKVTLTNVAGCDSVANLILLVTSPPISRTNITISSYQFPYLWNGNNYLTAGSFNVTIPSPTLPCDSIAILDLYVSPYLCPAVGNTLFISNLTGINYQWQLSTDSINFNSIINNNNYAGVNSDTLSLNNIPTSWYGYKYRCIVNGNSSNVSTLKFADTWTGISTRWEDPINWTCGSVPDSNTDVIINNGTIVLSSNATIRSLYLNPSALLTILTPFKLTITH